MRHSYFAPLVGGHWTIVASDDERKHVLDEAGIARGITLMATKHPRHFADLLNESEDAVTADVFIQLCLFGELIYG